MDLSTTFLPHLDLQLRRVCTHFRSLITTFCAVAPHIGIIITTFEIRHLMTLIMHIHHITATVRSHPIGTSICHDVRLYGVRSSACMYRESSVGYPLR